MATRLLLMREWLAKAEDLTPKLRRQRARPVGEVVLERRKGPGSFQGWRARRVGTMRQLERRLLQAGSSFVVDFGTEVVGHLEFEIQPQPTAADAPVRIKLVLGEMPAEVGEGFDGYMRGPGMLSRSWLQDEVVLVDDLPQRVTLPRRHAFRYLKLEIIDTSPQYKVHIRGLGCQTVTSADETKVRDLGKSHSPAVRAIDAVARRTLRCCMQTVFEDGPKRDRRLWLGDLRLQAQANYLTFRNYDLVKRCLYLFAGLRQADGIVNADMYEKPAPHLGQCRILDYALLFGPTVLDYAQASGDWDLARELWPVVKRQLELLKYVDHDGVFQDSGDWWLFIDWRAKLDKQAAVHGVMVYATRQTLELARRLGKTREVQGAQAMIPRMVAGAREHLWDEKAGAFVSGKERQVNWAAQAWMILGGVITAAEGRRALTAVARHKTALRPAGPYLWHHVLEAMLACGMERPAAQLLRDYWGDMVKKGATTFFENHDPADEKLAPYGSYVMNSYCHAWSCTPTYFVRKWPQVFR